MAVERRVRTIKFSPAVGQGGPSQDRRKEKMYDRAKRSPTSKPEVYARANRMSAGKLIRGAARGLQSAVIGAAAGAGYAIGTEINRRTGLSSKIADKVLELQGAPGYGSSGRGKVFSKNKKKR